MTTASFLPKISSALPIIKVDSRASDIYEGKVNFILSGEEDIFLKKIREIYKFAEKCFQSVHITYDSHII